MFLDTREKNEAFGSSLLLANSPMSPKIVNGSFAAIFDTDEFLAKAYAGIRIAVSFSCFYFWLISEVINNELFLESKFTGYAKESQRNIDVRYVTLP